MDKIQSINSKFNWLWRLALWCGLLPLIVGTGVFVGWLITDDVRLPVIGLSVVLVGLALFVLGHVLLVVYWFKAKPKLVKLLIPAFFLFINFPVAGYFMSSGYDANFGTFVKVKNHCRQRAKIELTGPNGKTETILVSGMGRATEKVKFSGEGAITYRFFIADKPVKNGNALGYFTEHLGFKLFFNIDKNCKLTISEKLGQSKL